MTKQPDQSFFRNLVLHCLDYVPNMPEEGMEHPDADTLRSIRNAVNFIRSHNYSWFLSLIANVPEEDRKRHDCLATQIRCLDLSDKNEELLVTCAVLVQTAHFTVMKHKCLESVVTAARALSDIFDEKYREIDWSGFERHCSDSIAKSDDDDEAAKAGDDTVDSVVRKEISPWCKTAEEKSILDFWEKKELKKLLKAGEDELACLRARMTRIIEPNERIVVTRAYNSMLRSRMEEYEHPSVGSQQTAPSKKCQKDGFCLGCLLMVHYPSQTKTSTRVEHSMFCQLWAEKVKERDLCATEIPRLPELLLSFVQKHLHFIFGTNVLKNVRNRLFRELDFVVETCPLCERQCSRKLVVCMDLYLKECVKKAAPDEQ